jgi:pSer/pThr/pTyr-binding forkhead associated (FHA) protein
MNMDKTILPAFAAEAETVYAGEIAETVGPQKALTQREVLNVPGQNSSKLKPSFFIYEKGKIRTVDIGADENIFHLGRGGHNEIVLDDNSISDTQVAVIRVGKDVYFMDCGTKDCVTFNGVKKRQAVTSSDSRMIMKIGQTWVVYLGIDSSMFDETDSIVLKRSLITTHSHQKSEAEVLLKSDQGEWYSDSAPIIVGSHNACDYRMKGQNIQPFHFMVYFNTNGVCVEDLTHGKPGIKINNMNCIGSRPIAGDVTISLNSVNIFLYVYGDAKARTETLFKNLNPTPNLALTNLKVNTPSVTLPKTNERLSIGRSEVANVIIPDPAVSRIHAHIVIRDKCLFLVDNNSHNKTYVNLKQIVKTTAKPGDIIEFGDTAFLLHYSNQ